MPTMLYGRDRERIRIGRLLDGARASRSGVLVIRGEAGVGKSALLEDARERAAGLLVLHGSGVESEARLPFAALHQLLRPVVGELDAVPAPQAAALRGALGLEAGGDGGRFLVSAAVLGKACQAYLLSTQAWKTLKGTASDASGVARVQVNVYRKAAGTCFAYTGDGFAKQRCDRADDAWVDAAVTGSSWKLALRSLPAGTYTIRVRASDRAKNTVTAFRSGQNQLVVKLA